MVLDLSHVSLHLYEQVLALQVPSAELAQHVVASTEIQTGWLRQAPGVRQLITGTTGDTV